MRESQIVENVIEKERRSSDHDNISRSNFFAPIRLKCSICESEFEKPANSRREVCSFKCKEERGRRYARKYQADGRRMLAELRRKFGGRHPTDEELYALLGHRRVKS